MNSVECPSLAIDMLPSDSLRVYLAIKFFLMQGGTETVSLEEMAQSLKKTKVEVALAIIHLCVQGWLRINLSSINDYFDSDKLKKVDWKIVDAKCLGIARKDFLLQAKNLKVRDLEQELNDGLEELIESINVDAAVLLERLENTLN